MGSIGYGSQMVFGLRVEGGVSGAGAGSDGS